MTEQPKLAIVTPSSAEVMPDPLDVKSLRLDQNYAETVGVQKALQIVPIRKPGKQEFFRVHPTFRDNFPLINLAEDREYYVVTRDLAAALATDITYATLFTCITRHNDPFLWPVKLPDPNGRQQDWQLSQRLAAEKAMERWVRIQANMDAKLYDCLVAPIDSIPDPDWPAGKGFWDLIEIAFKDRIIRSLDHPAVQRLHGLK